SEPTFWFRLAVEFPAAVPCKKSRRLLETLAHQLFDLDARLRVHSAGRKSFRRVQCISQRDGGHVTGRTVAPGCVEFSGLGSLPCGVADRLSAAATGSCSNCTAKTIPSPIVEIRHAGRILPFALFRMDVVCRTKTFRCSTSCYWNVLSV